MRRILNLKRWMAVLAVLVGLASFGYPRSSVAGLIATYAFTGGDPAGDAAAPTVANATFNSFSRTNVTAVSLSDQFASTDYTSANAIDLGEFVGFTVTAASGYKLDLESISLKHTRQDQNTTRTGPQNGAVRASFEGFAAGSGTGSAFSPVTTQTTSTWDFVDFSTAVGGSATFRFYGWNSIGNASANMRLLLDDVSLFGAVTLVPPPGTPPTVVDHAVNNVVAGDFVTHTFTANEPDGDTVTWNGFAFDSYTPAYGGQGTGPAAAANFIAGSQDFSWNSLGSPRGIYKWLVTANDKDGSDAGCITIHVTSVPEPVTASLLGLAALGLLRYRRRARGPGVAAC